MFADPCHRQIGEHFLAIGQAFERNSIPGSDDDVVKAENDTLWPSGRAGGVEDDRGVVTASLGDLVAQEVAIVAGKLAATLLHRRVIMQKRLIVVAHAARVGKDHALEEGATLLYR